MDFRSKMHSFLLVVVLVVSGRNSRTNADSRDEDKAAMDQFYETLSGLANSVVGVHHELSAGIQEGEQDVAVLTDSHSRISYEVKVMRLEQDEEVLSGKRTANSAEKEQGIAEAEVNITEKLTPMIEETISKLTELNVSMQSTTLTDDDLAQLQNNVNANLTEGEQIVIPSPSDMLSNVTAEIETVTPIFERLASTAQLAIINTQLPKIQENFRKMLGGGDEAQDFQQVALISEEIDASIMQIQQLNVLDSQSRMEL